MSSEDHPLPGWYPPGGFGAPVARESSPPPAETPGNPSDVAPALTHRRLPSGEVLCDPLGVPTDEAPRRLSPLEEAWRFIQGQARPGPARGPDPAASPRPRDPPDASERLIRAPSAVVMTDEHGRVAPVPGDPHLVDEASRGGGAPSSTATATATAIATHARTLSAASYHSRGSGGSVDLGDCDLGDLGDLLRLGDSDSDVDAAPGPSRLRVSSASAAATASASTPGALPPTPASPASASRAAAADAAKAAAKAAASAPQSEAARKTAIRKSSGGWLDGQRALSQVMTLLIREMKPLGMEGVATFDPLSGIMLWREQRRAAAARKRAVAELYPEGDDVDGFGGENPPDLRGLRLGARHAAAAYGSLAAILQNNSMQDKAHGFVGAVQAAFVSGDGDASATKATAAAARSAGVAPEDIVSADWVTLPFSPASYVAVDRDARTVVLAIRGTVSTSDLLTDACSTSVPFLGGWAHAGMVGSAYQVAKTQLPAATRALAENPGFAFLITGHSMGAGVAAILAMLLRSGDEDVLAATRAGAEAATRFAGASRADAEAAEKAATRAACHCFAAPSVCSLDLSLKAREHTTAVVAGKDVIPRLCYAAVRRLLRRLNAVAPSQPVMRAISAALGGRDKANAGAGGEGFGLGGEGSGSSVERRADEDENAVGGGLGFGLGFGSGDGSGDGSVSVPNPKPNPNPKPPPPLHDFGTDGASNAAAASEPGPGPRFGFPVPHGVSSPQSAGPSSESRCQGEWDDLEGNRGLELRDHAASDFLVQPGLVIHLRHLSSEDGPTAEVRHPTAFTEIPISTRMMTDHVPMVYQSAIDAVIAKREAEEAAAAEAAARRAEEEAAYGPGGYAAYVAATAALEEAAAARRAAREAAGRVGSNDTTSARSGGAGTRRRASRAESRRDDDDDDDPGRRLWANVRRSLGIGIGGGGGGGIGGGGGGGDDRSESSSGRRRRRGRRGGDSTDASEDDDIIAGLVELFGLDDDGDDDDRATDGDGEFPGDGSSSAPSTPRASPRARDGIARAPSWGLGRLGTLIGKIRKDTEGLFAGAPDAGAEDAETRDATEKTASGGAELGGAELGGAELGGAESGGAEGAEAGATTSDGDAHPLASSSAASARTNVDGRDMHRRGVERYFHLRRARALLMGRGAEGADGVPKVGDETPARTSAEDGYIAQAIRDARRRK